MLARVSNVEAYRRWRQDPDADPAALIERLTAFRPTEAMEAGTAFHKALELAGPGEYDTLEALGHTFILDFDAAFFLPTIREIRCYRDYGPIKVTGQVDALYGTRVEDHKTTAYFNAENYLDGCQWKFYLDIFGCQVFRWNVFPVKQVGPLTYRVSEPEILEAFSYAGLTVECEELARGYYEFVTKHMPGAA